MIPQLPFPPGTFRLRSFWTVLCAMVAGVSGSLWYLALATSWIYATLGIFVSLVIPGLLYPRLVVWPYRAFNKLIKVFSHLTNVGLSLVCFLIISLAVGKKGARLRLSLPNEDRPLWVARAAQTHNTVGNMSGMSLMKIPYESWSSQFIRMALESGNWWLCALLPYLNVVNLLGNNDNSSTTVPSRIYTLY